MPHKPDPVLRVHLHERHVADLTTRRGQLRLTYLPETVDELGVGGLCLSVALPVTLTPHAGAGVLHWSEGLLPEGETRTTLEQRFAVRRGDTFGLLEALGRECAGAVTLLSDDTPVTSGEIVALSEDELAVAVAQLPQRPLGVDDDVRVSLGGLQAKLLLVRTASGWAQPVAGTPSTHLLKPDPRELARPGLVVGEALVLRAAGIAGVVSAQVELAEVNGRTVLIVERYDRRIDGGAVVRLHQEDGCQALGLDPTGRRKYQSTEAGPPSFAALAEVLRDYAVDIRGELLRLGEAMTVNVAVGNTDGHARNHSFLLRENTVSLAPLYDVAPTFLFASARELGLWVDRQPYARYVTRSHLRREMEGWGVNEQDAAETVERTLVLLLEALPIAADELAPFVDEPLVRDTCERVRSLVAKS